MRCPRRQRTANPKARRWTLRADSATRAANGEPARSRFSGDRRAPAHQTEKDHTEPKERRVQVLVRDNNVDQALKALKKKMQREGIRSEERRVGKKGRSRE